MLAKKVVLLRVEWSSDEKDIVQEKVKKSYWQ
jgi:hypothetical protein